MRGTLIEIIDRLDEVDDSDDREPLCIFAAGGPDATPEAPAMIYACEEEDDDDDDDDGGDDDESFACPADPNLSYVLEVQQAKECIEVWVAWREGRRPTAQDKFAAVMHYSRNDAYLPVE